MRTKARTKARGASFISPPHTLCFLPGRLTWCRQPWQVAEPTCAQRLDERQTSLLYPFRRVVCMVWGGRETREIIILFGCVLLFRFQEDRG